MVAIVMPRMSLSAAANFAGSVCRRLSDEILHVVSVEIRVTASFGVSGFESATPVDASMDRLLKVADDCVYASKTGGRNTVTSRHY